MLPGSCSWCPAGPGCWMPGAGRARVGAHLDDGHWCVEAVWYRQLLPGACSCPRRGRLGCATSTTAPSRPSLEGEQRAFFFFFFFSSRACNGRSMAVMAWMADGPPGASVAGLRVADEAPTGETGFSVR